MKKKWSNNKSDKRKFWGRIIILKLLVLMNLGSFVQVSAAVDIQKVKLNLSMKESTLAQVLWELEKKTEITFFYSVDDVSKIKGINADFKDVTLDVILTEILKKTDLAYNVKNDAVVIYKKNVLNTTQEQQKEIKIQGSVSDDTGKPLDGASIILKSNFKIGTITDKNGNFELIIPQNLIGKDALVFSFIGMKSVEIPLNKKSSYNIRMVVADMEIGDLVVTGYQTLSKERATGSFEMINAQEIAKTYTSDLISRIESKVAGLKINNSSITIRGQSSILSNTMALIVVDGFPIEGGLETINPDDIENITVLKDAAAASIWGTRAANGVVVITTKRGKRGEKTNLDISYFLTTSQKSKFSDLHLLTAAESVDQWLDRIRTDNSSVDYVDYYHEGINKVEEAYYSTRKKLGTGATYDQIIANAEFQQNLDKLRSANFYKQYQKYLMRNALKNRLNMSLNGGSDKSDFYLSVVYNSNLPENIGNKNDDIVINFKHNYNLSDRFTLTTAVNTYYSASESNSVSFYNNPVFHNLVDESGKRIQYYMIDPWEGKLKEQAGYLPYTTNLIDEQEANNNTNQSFSARLQGMLNYKIIEGLNISTRFQYERGMSKRESLRESSHPSMRRMINAFTLVKEDGSLNLQFPLGASYDVSNSNSEEWTWRNQLDFNRTSKSGKHQITVLCGHEVRLYRSSSNSQSQYGFDKNSLYYLPVNEAMLINGDYNGWVGYAPYGFGSFNSYGVSDNRDVSVYTNAAYTYKNRYSASLSGRIDQSNIFGNDSKYRYNIIWSSGVSWKISEEGFAKNDWLNMLLLRATYGLGGNVNKSFYPVLMGQYNLDYWTGVSYVSLTNPANKNLKWETTKTLNFGLDYRVLNNKLTGSIDVYRRKGVDLLGRVSLDPTNGFSSATANFASLINKGIEFTVKSTVLKTKDIEWDLGLNVSYNNNSVIKVDDQGTTNNQYLQRAPGSGSAIEGKPLSRLYAYKYAGLDTDGQPMLWENGVKVKWSNYSKNIKDLVYEGEEIAPWYGGINTTFNYKQFSISALASYEFGNKFRMPSSNPIYGSYSDAAKRWRKAGDEKTTNVPLITDDWYTGYQMMPYYQYADIHVRNAAYIKLNELTLNYSMPKRVMGTFIKSLIFNFQVRNVYQWNANKENINPQTVLLNQGDYTFSDPRSYIIGIKANF